MRAEEVLRDHATEHRSCHARRKAAGEEASHAGAGRTGRGADVAEDPLHRTGLRISARVATRARSKGLSPARITAGRIGPQA
jgi:hypothetical protein